MSDRPDSLVGNWELLTLDSDIKNTTNSNRLASRLLSSVPLIVTLFTALGCDGKGAQQSSQPRAARPTATVPASPNSADECTAKFRAVVRECAPFSSGDVRDRKQFRLVLEVKSVERGGSDWLTVGATIELFVHSPVQTFPPVTENPTGREFEFCYTDPPAREYRGRVTVR